MTEPTNAEILAVMRDYFEKNVVWHFRHQDITRLHNGTYRDPIIEDHWNTFQDGWDFAIEYLKKKTNPSYTDIVSDGGMDPRK